MSIREIGHARAVADFAEGSVLASVEIGASPERIFQALTSKEIVDWWGRPGVFDVRMWSGDVRVGGRWQASGVARGNPYTLEGEFIEVDPPRKLVYTWAFAGSPIAPTTVTFVLQAIEDGTRITVRHSGFPPGESCGNACLGWESSLDRLAEVLASA